MVESAQFILILHSCRMQSFLLMLLSPSCLVKVYVGYWSVPECRCVNLDVTCFPCTSISVPHAPISLSISEPGSSSRFQYSPLPYLPKAAPWLLLATYCAQKMGK